MNANEDATMKPSQSLKVWINPPKYWAATQEMADEQKAQLLDQIEQLVLAGNVSALQKYEFVELNPERLQRKSNQLPAGTTITCA